MNSTTNAWEFPTSPYAFWKGRVFRNSYDSPGRTRISVLPGDNVPEGFEPRYNTHVRYVPDAELDQQFGVRLLCTAKGEEWNVYSQRIDGRFTVHLTSDQSRAQELGLVQYERGMPWVGDVSAAEITTIWLARHEIGDMPQKVWELDRGRDAPFVIRRHAPLDAAERDQLLERISATVRPVLAVGWQQLDIEFRATGSHSELDWNVTDANGTPLLWFPNPTLTALFVWLREGMYDPQIGTWLSHSFRLRADDGYRATYNHNDLPRWHHEPTMGDYIVELDRFPRATENTPAWIRALLPEPKYRQARIFDQVVPGRPPNVNRPAVPRAEVERILTYLDTAPAFLVERGFEKDLIDGAEDVPVAYHTDGTWIWPADVPHYLRKHGIAPEPDLVNHIRSQDFTVPEENDLTVAEAEASITGQPIMLPPIPMRLTTKEQEELRILQQRLDEYGVSRSGAYLFRRHGDHHWCLERTEAGWQVAYYDNGEPVNPVVFDRLAEASAQLLGSLLIDPLRARLHAPEIRETQAVLDEWPIQPLGGEPPLTLLRDKRMIVLPAGDQLVRYGSASGNLTFAKDTPFSAMSLRAERAEQGPRVYHVRRPLQVLTGTTVPWHNQPGGSTAYLLPRSLERHVAPGSLWMQGEDR